MARRILAVSTALDLVSLAAAQVVASMATFGTVFAWHYRDDVWTMIGGITGGGIIGLWVATRTGRNGVPRPSYGRAFSMVALAMALTSAVILFGRPFWSRGYVAISGVTWLGLAIAHRWVRRRRPWAERMVLVTNEKTLVQDISNAPHAEVLEVLDPTGPMPDRPLPPGVSLAVDLRTALSDEMARFVSSCNLAGYPMRSLVSTYEEHTGRLAIVHLFEGWELTVPLSNRGNYVRTKRVLDTLLVLLVAPVALVLSLLVALLIKLESRGPIIFKQRRIGLEGRPFTLYKFRTMKVRGSDEGPSFARPGDRRLTRLGKVLRPVRLDELPQLWNILRGDLSIVGPRPEQGPFVDRFSETIPFYTHRHLVRPGLTGWAQVNFGYADSETDTVEKLSYDLYYVKHVSPWLDLEILGRSVWTVISGFGAR